MNEALKNLLKSARLYYPLHAKYRAVADRRLRSQYRRQYRAYSGRGFICNFCGAQYERFVPWLPAAGDAGALVQHKVIAGYGDNIICPNCLSTARERLVLAFLKTSISVEGNILHLAPEPLIHRFLKSKARVITADFEPGFYRSIDSLVRKADATALPFESSSFELVVANHILEHIPDDRQAMREIFRVLKPGGAAILQVPYSATLKKTIEDSELSDPAMQSKLFGQKDHVRIYSLNDYVNRLRSAGFEVEVTDAAEFTSYAVQEGEIFFHIHKPLVAPGTNV